MTGPPHWPGAADDAGRSTGIKFTLTLSLAEEDAGEDIKKYL